MRKLEEYTQKMNQVEGQISTRLNISAIKAWNKIFQNKQTTILLQICFDSKMHTLSSLWFALPTPIANTLIPADLTFSTDAVKFSIPVELQKKWNQIVTISNAN